MGKKRFRKSYISKGQRHNVDRDITSALRRERNPFDKALNVLSAWRSGKNPWVTIDNPDRNQTNKRSIKVRANAYYGNYKEIRSNLFKSSPAA